jgi:molecular chaperone DnaJ
LQSETDLRLDDVDADVDVEKIEEKGKCHLDLGVETMSEAGTKMKTDRGGNEDEFKKINEAYSTLSDSEKRQRYDNQKNNPFEEFGFNMGGDNPFDIFSSMFGGRQQRRAPDRIIDLKIGAVDSFVGKKIDVSFSRKTNCSPCKGKGGNREKCSVCNGSGSVVQRVGNAFFQNIMQTPCGACSGKGYKLTNVCNICNGEGRVDELQKVSIINRRPLLRKNGF